MAISVASQAAIQRYASLPSVAAGRRMLAVNGIGCVFTALILLLTVTLKFDEGGWITLLLTGTLIGIALWQVLAR